jgi:hypothetical protein
MGGVSARRLSARRHCEERSDAAIQESQDRSGLLRFARNDGNKARALTRGRLGKEKRATSPMVENGEPVRDQLRSGPQEGSEPNEGVGTWNSPRPKMSAMNTFGPEAPPGSRKNIT